MPIFQYYLYSYKYAHSYALGIPYLVALDYNLKQAFTHSEITR